jgi:hypothetical protein
MDTFARTSTSASRLALRASAAKLTTVHGSIGAFVVLAIVAAAAASAGAFGTFTSSKNASHSVTAGTVVIALGATGAETNRFDVAATDVAPGDTIERSIDLSNTGSLDLASIKLTTEATTSSLLDTDTTNGLQMKIDDCDQAWTEAGTSPAYTYTCGGTQTAIVTSEPVIQSDQDLSASLTASGTDHLLLTLSLPTSADDTFQGTSSTIKYTFDATQRTGTNR